MMKLTAPLVLFMSLAVLQSRLRTVDRIQGNFLTVDHTTQTMPKINGTVMTT
jgi:hypothetical protein